MAFVDPKTDPNDYTRVPSSGKDDVKKGSGMPQDQTSPPGPRAKAWADQYLPGGAKGVENLRRRYRQFRKGRFIPKVALEDVNIVSDRLGYNRLRDDLSEHFGGELGGPSTVNLRRDDSGTLGTISRWAREGGADAYHMDETPTVGRLSSYVQERLGVGLTPEEEAVVRGRGIDAANASATDAARSESSRMAAAGLDPRSGLGTARYGNIAAMRARNLAEAERDVTAQDLGRKRDMEGLATSVAGLEESQRGRNIDTDLTAARMEEAARQYDVGTEEARRRQVEGGMAGLTGLSENQRQYDIDYTESQRQARLARMMMRRAARAMQPTSLEKWAAGVGGFFQGLGM